MEYRIITLDAMKFLDESQENVTFSCVKKKDGVWGADFFCDLSGDLLSGRPGGIDCVITESCQDGNSALFHQILKALSDPQQVLRLSRPVSQYGISDHGRRLFPG